MKQKTFGRLAGGPVSLSQRVNRVQFPGRHRAEKKVVFKYVKKLGYREYRKVKDIHGHRTLKAPHPVRSAQLTRVPPS